MKIHRFIGNFDFSGDSVEITGDLAHQMHAVLRLRPAEPVILGNGEKREVLGEISQIEKGLVRVVIRERVQNLSEPKRRVRLYCSILKRENFELVVQKAAEVGVREIIPIIATRTIKLRLNMERLRKIIHEAAEQSGRGVVPVLHEMMQFEEAVVDAEKDELSILFDASGEPFKKMPQELKKINLFIGPEGGWTPEELKKAQEVGFHIASLGKLTLRAETAAIVGSYLLVSA